MKSALKGLILEALSLFGNASTISAIAAGAEKKLKHTPATCKKLLSLGSLD